MTETEKHFIGGVWVEGEDLGNWRTGVFRCAGTDKAVKADRSVAILNPRKINETESGYRERLKELSRQFINRERMRAGIIERFLPETVFVPAEHYFLGDDNGLPTAIREQQFVGGKALTETDLNILNAEQNAALGGLALAAIRGYEETGEMLDLAGWQGGRNKNPIILMKLFFQPFKYSSNIKIDDDGKVCLIDAKPVTAKNTLPNRLKRYLMYVRLKLAL